MRPGSDRPQRSSRILDDDGPIAALVAARRWDEALVKLGDAQAAAPRDADIADAIRTVRDRMLASGIEKLGSSESIPSRTGTSPVLGADERYLLELVDGESTLDAIVAVSTLGRHRSVRGLSGLLDVGAIRIASSTRSRPVSEPTLARQVVVADGHASSAAITRTMLRIALGASAKLETVMTTAQLTASGSKHRPDLVVTELTLADGDALAAVRALRKTMGHAVPVLVITSRMEHALALGRAPERSAVLARPIEKTALESALTSLGVARKS